MASTHRGLGGSQCDTSGLFCLPFDRPMRQPSAEARRLSLRARSLEIVDSIGRTRAQIVVAPASTVDGVPYPETVLSG